MILRETGEKVKNVEIKNEKKTNLIGYFKRLTNRIGDKTIWTRLGSRKLSS